MSLPVMDSNSPMSSTYPMDSTHWTAPPLDITSRLDNTAPPQKHLPLDSTPFPAGQQSGGTHPSRMPSC